jgi:Rab-like protein 2
VTRKVTYTNLVAWYTELRKFCPHIPTICIANKIDVDYAVTSKAFAFPKKEALPFFFVSAADGTNVVAIFREAIELAWAHKQRGEKDFAQEVLDLIDEDKGRGIDDKALGAFGRALYPNPGSPGSPAGSAGGATG